MRSASATRRNRRRWGHLATGIGIFVLLLSLMTASDQRGDAGGMTALLTSRALAGPYRTDAVALAAAPDFERTAVAAASLSPAIAGAPRYKGTIAASVTLAAVLAALAVFNLGLLGHLRRVYASPRRGVWRRG